MATVDRTTGSGSQPDDLSHVLDVASAQLDREFQRAERLDTKARAQVTLAASWFTVAQAVAGLSLRDGGDSAWVLVPVFAFLLLGAVTLALLAAATREATQLQTRNDITPETLAAMEESAKAGSPDFTERLVETYRKILGEAQAANERRAVALEPSRRWDGWRPSAPIAWWCVLGFGLLEIVAALLVRAFG
jgi:hypothetical protein